MFQTKLIGKVRTLGKFWIKWNVKIIWVLEKFNNKYY